MRELPFFGTAWSYMAAHCVLSGKDGLLRKITKDISTACHDYDFDLLKQELDAITKHNFRDLITSLKARREGYNKHSGPTGYTDIKIAVFESFEKESYQEAKEILNSVYLEENDFPWLADVRTLAKAKAAKRFGKIEEEKALTSQFLASQPILFEPDHAVSFGLLDYQEIIKPKAAILFK